MQTTALVPVIDLPFLQSEINDAHKEVQKHARGMLLEAKRAGEALLAAKKLVKHGEFKAWVASHCPFTYERAARYMKVARLSRSVDLHTFDGGIDAFLDVHASFRVVTPEPAPAPSAPPTFGPAEASYILKLQGLLLRGAEQEQLTAADKIEAFAARFDLTGEEAIAKSAVLIPNPDLVAVDAEHEAKVAESERTIEELRGELAAVRAQIEKVRTAVFAKYKDATREQLLEALVEMTVALGEDA
jgi:uncharacterized coiled-coil protein SlyX